MAAEARFGRSAPEVTVGAPLSVTGMLVAILAGCLLALAGLAAGPVAGDASASSIIVNTVGDARTDDGVCSLREAIVAGNSNAASGSSPGECQAGEADPVVDRIDFAFIGMISPGSSLPVITEILDIDATGVPGEVRLDGDSIAVPYPSGFSVNADGSTIRGLTITSFYIGVDLADVSGVTVSDNLIGTNAAGSAGLGNVLNVNINDAADSLIKDNTIADGAYGVRIVDSGSSGNVIVGNRIGTDPTGAFALQNTDGIDISRGASDTRIGGLTQTAENLISGNYDNAISVKAEIAGDISGTRILGNRIGTSLDGWTALANGQLATDSAVAIVGDVHDGEIRGNLISGNSGNGLHFSDSLVQPAGSNGPTDNVIAGNLVGLKEDGETVLPNGGSGVWLESNNGHPAVGNRLGGPTGPIVRGSVCSGDCNVIAADSGPAVKLSGTDLQGTTVIGNHIGFGLDGVGATDGGDAGILLQGSTGSQVGQPDAPNYIAAALDGIRIEPPTVDAIIQANWLGVRPDGATSPAFAFTEQGIDVTGTEAQVGGTGPDRGNRIFGATEEGVLVGPGAERVALLGNLIEESGDLGIDLDPVGVTNNDSGGLDADTGANGLQNFPELEAVLGGAETRIAGRLESSADTGFRLEFFSNQMADPSGHGEGEGFLGAVEVSTDNQGQAEFITTVSPVQTGPDSMITATATSLDATGAPVATSEFGADLLEGDQCDASPTTGDDVLCGTGGVDLIDGLGGDDVIFGLGSGDQLDGSEGDDRILGDEGGDTLTGGSGEDQLFGGAQNDLLNSRDGGQADLDDCGTGSDEAIADEADTFSGCEATSNDTTAPETTIDGGPADGSTQETTSASFPFSASESGSIFFCTVDGGAATGCATPYVLTGLAIGSHTFTVAATDSAGNFDPSPAAITFTVVEPVPVDSKAPVLTLSGKHNQKDKNKVVVKAKCSEKCDLAATGSIRVKILKRNGKLKKIRKFSLKEAKKKNASSGKKHNLKLKFTGKTRNKLSKVIRRKRSKATVKVTATDAAGNKTSKKFKVTVKKPKKGK